MLIFLDGNEYREGKDYGQQEDNDAAAQIVSLHLRPHRVKKHYPADFSNQERMQLEYQLPHFQFDVCNHPELKGLSSLVDLTSGLVKLDKDSSYPMVDKLLRLLLTLPVSTATTKRAFSAMKFVKTRLRRKMRDVYLRDYLVV